MPCRQCQHYHDSTDANKPRWGLLGYGYCKAAPSPELRARFFPDTTAPCWLEPPKYQERRHAPT